MFCPECGTLGFMSPDGNIRCTDYKCGYEGPLSGSDGKGAEFTDPMTGETVDLSKATASSSAKDLKHLTEVVEEEVAKGTLWVGLGRVMNPRQKYAPARVVGTNSVSINDYSSDPLRGSYSVNIVWNIISEP